ncbi:hypothetical protein [Microcoleus sp. FACHB-672]|uniref:hypothetical protein n=1 Tax=Microcoleus sp. FACHB-672 TaxID=2692825 RepID=UPI0016828AEE|nr:hypothetical protein [Microcoleus sp. FACHB-672]MBD2040497.1 hypothetical protein [Microcoleus sp. FACHB-672]MBW4679928.1 hypothetical protein [Microcoleus vaginatus WJT46-NPBG5]
MAITGLFSGIDFGAGVVAKLEAMRWFRQMPPLQFSVQPVGDEAFCAAAGDARASAEISTPETAINDRAT